jgi:hypothetical protein
MSCSCVPYDGKLVARIRTIPGAAAPVLETIRT